MVYSLSALFASNVEGTDVDGLVEMVMDIVSAALQSLSDDNLFIFREKTTAVYRCNNGVK